MNKETYQKIEKMREKSGNIEDNRNLVAFLYVLLRDHLSAGVLEGIMQDIPKTKTIYTNGYIAQYAQDITDRLLEEN